jgi:hypothetical protein
VEIGEDANVICHGGYTVNKNDLVAAVADETGLSKADVGKAVDATFATIVNALRGGIKTVLIPKDNEKDLAEIPDNVKKGLKIIPVAIADEVLNHALVRQPEPVEWVEVEPEAVAASGVEDPASPRGHLPN